ncbi:MAG: hypothetical protein H6709_16480 [Kofleriaceae bacterium]|nr:hypothetical protein [Myxococcales bacterium]MCB9563386.1 hypothetical protein [Kofleriaceae bacterium]MCB9573678.1 hypothetical protein [Kofleriaceae bacterium]
MTDHTRTEAPETPASSHEAGRTDPDAWDRVDEAGDETFPASDPPAWNVSHASTEPPEPVADAAQARRPWPRRARAVVEPRLRDAHRRVRAWISAHLH